MNHTYSSNEAAFSGSEPAGPDPLHATTGLVWGTVLGSVFWLIVLTLVFTR